MLKITIPAVELYDEAKEEFISEDESVLVLEHSLLSVSKWEAQTEKPFLAPGEKSTEEILAYIECMNLSGDFPLGVLFRLSSQNFEEIYKYIESPQSATRFSDTKTYSTRVETITSELIYYWMVSYNIPFECETWHLNRLLALIRVCNLKASKPKKMNTAEAALQRQELNAKRRAEFNSTG